MIVLDASLVVDYLLNTNNLASVIAARLGEEGLAAPHLIDIEVAHVLRRLVQLELITATRAAQALDDLQNLPLQRYEHVPFLPRIFALRDNFTAYDAAYIALAEFLSAVVLTRDARLAGAASCAEVV